MSAGLFPSILLITGSMAAGKSTVAQALAERLPKSVHLRGDLFRRMIINGRAQMTHPLTDEAHSQLQLRYDLAAAAARRYVEAGFTVIYQDIVIGPALPQLTAALRPPAAHRPFSLGVVVLCPPAAVLAARDLAREKTGYPDRAAVDAFDRILRAETPRIGYWLDNSTLSVPETVEQIFSHLDEVIV